MIKTVLFGKRLKLLLQVRAYGTFNRQTLPGTSGAIGFSPWWQGQLPPDILAPVDGGEGGACKWAVQ